MTLDLPTLMVMQSFAMACAGSVLLIAWLQDRDTAPVGLWGVAHLLAAAGIVALMLAATLHLPIWAGVGGTLLSMQSGLIWKAVRTIDGKRAPLLGAVLGPALVALAGAMPITRTVAGSLALTMGAAYILAAAVSLWCGRDEGLKARWPLAALAFAHAVALTIGTYSTFDGSTDQSTVPSLGSLFGFIYFESIIFALGTAVFVLALIKERKEAAGRKAASLDSLTGVANRAAFLAYAAKILERCRYDNTPVSVIMFDLDRFKSINDRYGHATGDAVLQKFCEIAAAALRPGEIFGRIGGEEFAVVVPGASIEVACMRAERIRLSFADQCGFIHGHQVNATVSGGVAAIGAADATLDAVLECADRALYEAKSEGRNRIKRAAAAQPDGASYALRIA